MHAKEFQPQDALQLAQKLWLGRYSGSEFCIAAGSIITGNGTAFSDLDLVVIFPEVDSAYRESFITDNMPVEAFVHDYQTIQAFIDSDYEDAHASIINMIATGITIPVENKTSLKLKGYAKDLLDAGPKEQPQEKEDALRYFITDLIDDLRGNRPPEEQRAILYKLYPQIGELALRKAGKFVSNGKHLARKLKQHCPEVLSQMEEAMHAAHCGKFQTQHVDALDHIANSLGGLLFDGYMQKAPSDKRKKAVWLEAAED